MTDLEMGASAPATQGYPAPRELAEAAMAIGLTQAATWSTYLLATWFLTYLLPGYPTRDWLCSGHCTPASFAPVALPFFLVALGQLLLFRGLRSLSGPAAAWSALALSLASPGVVLPLVSTGWALAFLLSGIVVQVKAFGRTGPELAAAVLCGAAPLPIGLGLVLALAFWQPRGRSTRWAPLAVLSLGCLAVAASASLRLFHPAVPLPGPVEQAGAWLLGWCVAIPLVVAGTASLLDERRRGLGLMVLGALVVGLVLGETTPLRLLGVLPLSWLIFTSLPRVYRLSAVAALALLQGVLLYHVAHGVPLL